MKSPERKRDADTEDEGDNALGEERKSGISSTDADFLSVADRMTLNMAKAKSGISEDGPDFLRRKTTGNAELRCELILPTGAGGIDLSQREAHVFLRRVDADRAALLRVDRKDAEANAKELQIQTTPKTSLPVRWGRWRPL